MEKNIFEVKKMISYFLLFFILISGCVMYKPPATQTVDDLRPIEFTEVVSAEGFTKNQLYSAALAWFSRNFRSAKNVIDIQDKEAGRIVGKPLFSYYPSELQSSAIVKGPVNYDVIIEVKNGRYRYFIGNFVHTGTPSQYSVPISFGLITNSKVCPYRIEHTTGWVQNRWNELQSRSRSEAAQLIASMKRDMVKLAQKTDW